MAQSSISKFSNSLLPFMVEGEDGDCVFSSYSLFSVLGMTSAGSDGNTLEEFRKVLFVDQRIHEEMKKLHSILEKEKRQLSIAEAIFTQVEIRNNFKITCSSNYQAVIQKTKFPDPGKDIVNEYVAKHTNGMIKELLEDVDPVVRMILVNAIYFKANWKTKFKVGGTKKGYKFNSFGDTHLCDMMVRNNSLELFSRNKIDGVSFTTCCLPYKNDKFVMIFLKPDQEGSVGMEDVMKKVVCGQRNFVDILLSKQRKVKLRRVHIPKFTIESSFDLDKVLQKMGLVDAFDVTKANFSRMTNEEELYIDQVIHKAKIIVDESGTEAAASTAVLMGRGRGRPKRAVEVNEFVLDRPFFCFIVHNLTGIVMFSTRVVKPKYE